MNSKSQVNKTRWLVTVAMLSGIAVVLMLLDFPVPFLPPFYKIDFSELPVLIGAFCLGPVAGIVIELIKVLLNLLINGTVTMGIGEAANFFIGCAFVVPAGLVYLHNKNKKSAILGMCVGTASCTVIGCILNAFVLLPLYGKAFGGLDNVIAAGTSVNSAIKGMTSFILLATAPLNLIKCISVSVIAAFIYKPLSRIIKGYK